MSSREAARYSVAANAPGRTVEQLSRAPRGRVVAIFANDSDIVHEDIQSWAAASSPPSTLVTLAWERAPRLFDELDETVVALSQAAVTLFPELYASAVERETTAMATNAPTVRGVASSIRGASAKAVQQILDACREGTAPTLTKLPRAERVRQLSLALDPQQLVIELLVRSPEPPPRPGVLYAFGRGAAWLASNSGARVVMLVPTVFGDSPELDGVVYGAAPSEGRKRRERAPVANDNSNRSSPPRRRRKSAETSGASSVVEAEETAPVVSVGAVVGKPHPGSEAEQTLHARITADSELASLFRFNQLVRTVHGTTPRVDLVWVEGKLVVEIDSHADHSKAGKFIHDRERDYQLLVSGYRVVRVPEALVLVDPQLTLERIRATVRYLRQEIHGT